MFGEANHPHKFRSPTSQGMMCGAMPLDEVRAALRAIREVIEAHVPPDHLMVNFEHMPGTFGPKSDELIRGILAIAQARGL